MNRGEGKGGMIRFSFQKTTVAALCRMDCRGPGVGGRPGTTVVKARDNSASGDNGSEDGEGCKILEDT